MSQRIGHERRADSKVGSLEVRHRTVLIDLSTEYGMQRVLLCGCLKGYGTLDTVKKAPQNLLTNHLSTSHCLCGFHNVHSIGFWEDRVPSYSRKVDEKISRWMTRVNRVRSTVSRRHKD